MVEVIHGARVETTGEYFAEAVWDGDYGSGDLDRTDIVFGSGARVRDGRAIFVSSGSTLDRLQSVRVEDGVWISNSLVCLLSVLGAEVDPAYGRYVEDFRSIIKGLRSYKRTLSTSVGDVRFTYFENLQWDGSRLAEVGKANPPRAFSSYEKYRSFLSESLGALARNMSSPARKYPYQLLGALSSGYDSPAVSVLALPHGLREAITFHVTRDGAPDSGDRIAKILGLRTIPLSLNAWRHHPRPEAPFLAADANGGEVVFRAASDVLPGRVLLTGFHGDRVWERVNPELNDDFVRGDQSGLSFSEYRLWVGFIHCPVPFMGARNATQINALSNSRELSPWSVAEDYDRPICRRIAEDAGVPRGEFGVRKKYGSLRLALRSTFWEAPLVPEYLAWLREHRGAWLRRWRLPPLWISRLVGPFQSALMRALKLYCRITGRSHRESRITKYWEYLANREYLYKALFPWAMHVAKRRYANGPAFARSTAALGAEPVTSDAEVST